jgi:hypothetical protein
VGGKLTFFGIDYGKSVNWEMKDAARWLFNSGGQGVAFVVYMKPT